MKKYIFIITVFFSLNSVSQNSKKLDSLAKEIHFKIKDTILKEGSLKVIKEIAVLLKENKYSYYIESHTDSRGKSKENLFMTKTRAKLVKKTLVDLGISEVRLIDYGFGEDYPVVTVCSRTADRSPNRRIEIKRIP